jgi:hypothetical protein
MLQTFEQTPFPDLFYELVPSEKIISTHKIRVDSFPRKYKHQRQKALPLESSRIVMKR